MHEKRIEIRWRDVDNYGHVNNAVYLTYLEEVRDEWLAQTLRDEESVWDYVHRPRRDRLPPRGAPVRRRRRRDLPPRAHRDLERPHARADPHGGRRARRRGLTVLVARDREAGTSRPIAPAERAALRGRELEPAPTGD